MIEIKETENLNIGPEDQPGGTEPHKELLVWNKENIEEYLKECPKDEKENIIVPDDFFDQYYRILPDKVVNASRSWRTANGGKIHILGGDPERDKRIFKIGADASNATQAQRRTMAEDLKYLLSQEAQPEVLERVNLKLPEGCDNQTAIMAAALLQASEGNVKAQQFIRDTIGEQPTTKQEITADVMTDHDRDLIEKLQKKLEGK